MKIKNETFYGVVKGLNFFLAHLSFITSSWPDWLTRPRADKRRLRRRPRSCDPSYLITISCLASSQLPALGSSSSFRPPLNLPSCSEGAEVLVNLRYLRCAIIPWLIDRCFWWTQLLPSLFWIPGNVFVWLQNLICIHIGIGRSALSDILRLWVWLWATSPLLETVISRNSVSNGL